MIAPRTHHEAEGRSGSLAETVDAFFASGGGLERAGAGEPFPYEPRPQQRAMAAGIAQAIETGGHLAVEAGTGVGKSFAYLVPLIHAARARAQQVVVSTYTIALQEQLMHKDVPFLQAHLGVPFEAVLVKGRGNYLCLRRLARARKHGPELFPGPQALELDRLRAWADRTAEGSLQDLSEQPPAEVWSAVCAEAGNCLYHKCPDFGRCFLMKARARLRGADLLVVNHHLFFSELALRAQGAAFLPPYDLAVLDEAHMLENVASEHLGLRLSHYGFEHWLRRLYVAETGKGLLATLKRGPAALAVSQLAEEVDRFYGAVRGWAGFKEEAAQKIVDAPLALETELPELLRRALGHLNALTEELTDEDLKAELASARRQGVELRTGLTAFLEQSLDDQVYWVEREGRRRQQTVLHSAPIEVGPVLETALFAQLETVILTSATLAVGDDLGYFKRRIGAGAAEELQLGSPFDYARHMRVFIPKGLPDPNEAASFAAAAARAIEHFLRQTRGSAFVLFTSSALLRQVAARLAPVCEAQGYPLLVQGQGLPRHAMLERFRKHPGSVLLGLDSFWMGVDVRGEALQNVIITRLPFAVPDQPVVKARMDRIRERGGDPFRDYSLPEAILKFRQGVGRLIRTATDEGIVVVLDPRILSKWYGKRFLAALPECPVEIVELDG